MRYLILSDIHANWEALDAVLEAAQKDGFDQIVCCGDLVGYGADPNAVTDWVRSTASFVVRGNHDKACVGLENLDWFNPVAKTSALWTASVLREENVEYLRKLPKGPVRVTDFQILHGSPVDEDEYLMQSGEVAQLAGYLDTRISFFGHTHVQGGFIFQNGGMVKRVQGVARKFDHEELILDPQVYYLINPGSVGQPRDSDPRAAWCIYYPQDRRIMYRRVAYDIKGAQAKIRAARLPDLLARRLSAGH
ncbi:MAG: metallophosphoesterase family protein [Bryobacterales bacterium]|nr:metallophosphoesterase family protein [Bryobacterales bacterium]